MRDWKERIGMRYSLTKPGILLAGGSISLLSVIISNIIYKMDLINITNQVGWFTIWHFRMSVVIIIAIIICYYGSGVITPILVVFIPVYLFYLNKCSIFVPEMAEGGVDLLLLRDGVLSCPLSAPNSPFLQSFIGALIGGILLSTILGGIIFITTNIIKKHIN